MTSIIQDLLFGKAAEFPQNAAGDLLGVETVRLAGNSSGYPFGLVDLVHMLTLVGRSASECCAE
ncbi:hypothetical protein BMF89_16665 [Arthrobacter sp. SRS-W-1-2016]|uniref:hypothetical protein n=1 Tax=Arthrobacter sp. SRS-W-1-2016 TaxID=1930254 RepID=UPI000990D865|nr:hypothetical protein [Arthrobacter sp. SRS-W-1-2016]OOP60498.1 hypothetical protein BMF89_16665 [Arthrobacter sp. SRS-W-1-2016]